MNKFSSQLYKKWRIQRKHRVEIVVFENNNLSDI